MANGSASSENKPMEDRNRMMYLHTGAAALTWSIVTGITLYLLLRGDQAVPGLSLYLLFAGVNLAATLYACRDTQTPLRRRQIRL